MQFIGFPGEKNCQPCYGTSFCHVFVVNSRGNPQSRGGAASPSGNRNNTNFHLTRLTLGTEFMELMFLKAGQREGRHEHRGREMCGQGLAGLWAPTTRYHTSCYLSTEGTEGTQAPWAQAPWCHSLNLTCKTVQATQKDRCPLDTFEGTLDICPLEGCHKTWWFLDAKSEKPSNGLDTFWGLCPRRAATGSISQ